jgi:hypothetical protein
MDNSSKRRVGRPKASPQTGPLVLEARRARMTMELPLADGTADELKEYVRWVELSSTVTTKDASFATVDFALRDVFRRDRLWQEQRRRGAEGKPSRTLKTAPPASPSASLPPPNGTAAPRGPSDRAI